jgi:hypothetical protein
MLLLLFIVWAMGINVLAFRLRAHLRNPEDKEFFGLFPRGIYIADFFRPNLFTEEGNRLRIQSRNWFLYGGLLVLLLFAFSGG